MDSQLLYALAASKDVCLEHVYICERCASYVHDIMTHVRTAGFSPGNVPEQSLVWSPGVVEKTP